MEETIVNILALVGTIYGVARIVVALTPTPKDDAALAQVGLLLTAIAKVTGLDLRQGVQKKEKTDANSN